ncbi:hypothetical protein KI387_040988, partial [Taxus chinensis]
KETQRPKPKSQTYKKKEEASQRGQDVSKDVTEKKEGSTATNVKSDKEDTIK